MSYTDVVAAQGRDDQRTSLAALRAILNQSSDENHMHYATNYVGFTCASV